MNWQPIETAPKRERILLFLRSGTIVCGEWDFNEFHKKPRPYWTNDLERMYGTIQTRDDQPIHWMPLPEPPQ